MKFNIIINYLYTGLFLLMVFSIPACKKFLDIEPPVTSISAANVFEEDATAIAVLTKLYTQMSIETSVSMATYPELSGDNMTLFNLNSTDYYSYYGNALAGATGSLYWNQYYNILYATNYAIEGLNKSEKLTTGIKNQLIGEAHFVRAFCYYYLVNMFEKVPLVLTTDYKTTSLLPRSPGNVIYAQIISDLKLAQSLLSENYLAGNLVTVATERVRPTKHAATALLARVYLFQNDAVNAEAMASQVISKTSYNLTPLNNSFLKTSTEAIWQLQTAFISENTKEGMRFVLPAGGPNAGLQPINLSQILVNSFEVGDNRLSSWIGSVTSGGITYYYPYKYKVNLRDQPITEYSMVLRLAEQYLIRAEARAMQDNIEGAQNDLNAVRVRAGLDSTVAETKTDLLAAVLDERRHELFGEWGHRWFDIKRTNTIDSIMSVATPLKGGIWEPYKQWYPISSSELLFNPNLTQTDGY